MFIKNVLLFSIVPFVTGSLIAEAPSSQDPSQMVAITLPEDNPILEVETPPEGTKVQLDANYNQIGSASVSHPHKNHRKKLSFAETTLLATYMKEIRKGSGLNTSIGYDQAHFHWKRGHLGFKNKNFNNLLLGLGGYTTLQEKYLFNAHLTVQRNLKGKSLTKRTFYISELYGKYSLCQESNLYLGLISFNGMHYNRVLPLLGFDYQPSEKWQIKAIFPTNMGVSYFLNKEWSIEGALRWFLSRQRLDKKEKDRLILYRSTGLEAKVNYQLLEKVNCNVHLGHTFGGHFTLGNHKDNHRHHYKLRSSPYFGAQLNVAF